jgi:hypothetical protein
MPASPATRRDVPNSRARIITSILLVLIGIMIVRDIFARRWSSAPPPLPDVTQHSP